MDNQSSALGYPGRYLAYREYEHMRRKLLALIVAIGSVVLIIVMARMYRESEDVHVQAGDDRLKPIEYVKEGVRTTIEHGWYPNSIGIAERVYTGAFGHHSFESGKGTLIRLFRNDFIVDSFDGASYFVISFQLPSQVDTGKKYQFRPIPSDRPVEQISKYTEAASMQVGEFTAFQYGNPMMGWMEDDKDSDATVTILEIGEFEMIIHVRLVADLKPMFDFDLDQEFTLRKMAEGAR